MCCLLLCSMRIYQYLATIFSNFGIIASEMHYGWPSPSVPVLQSGNYTITINSGQASWLTVTHPIGSMCGALVAGLIVDKIGRKKLVVLTAVPFMASWLMIATAKSAPLLFTARFLSGVLDGISFTTIPMYVAEIADSKIRGFLASAVPVNTVLGFLIINALSIYYRLDTVAFIATAAPILLLLTFPWMPESPYYFLVQGKVDDAKRSLQTFRGTEDVYDELYRMAQAVKEEEQSKGSLLDLLKVRSNRKALFIILGLFGTQQMSGRSVIIFYCKTIFEESNNIIPSSYATIIYFSVQLAFAFLASVVVDHSGRRPLLVFSATGSAMALLANGVYLTMKHNGTVVDPKFDFVPVAALLVFVVTFSFGLQTIPHLMMGELFPTSVKAFALCAMDIYNSILETASSKFFHWSNETYGLYVPFFAFTASSLLGLAFIISYVPETKQKTLEDIQIELRGDEKKYSPMQTYGTISASYKLS